MKPPPLLLGAALLFWGWQTDFLVAGAVMAALLEAARLVKTRWEFSDDDFSRIWTLCTLLFIGAAVFAFTSNGGPAKFSSLFQNPNPATQGGAGTAIARSNNALFRWLPMLFFPFIAAQIWSTRENIPLTTISLILRMRWKRAGKSAAPVRGMNIAYPYFGVCLFSAAMHPAGKTFFFPGLCVLLVWALWFQRARRYGIIVWTGALALAIALGFGGQAGLGKMENYLQNLNPLFFARFFRHGFDPAQSRTSFGEIGSRKASGEIVIRLEPLAGAAPNYLRAASYRRFSSPSWFAGSSKDDFQPLPETPPNSGNFVLVRGRTNTAAARITCFLDGRWNNGSSVGLLPLPSGSAEVKTLSSETLLKANSAGAVLAEGPGLLQFDARYGLGATLDSPPDCTTATNEDLLVPERETRALDRVLAELQLSQTNFAEARRVLGGFFASRFTYSLWQAIPRSRSTNETDLARFLLRTRRGHCEYFATATVLLLRRLGVPARYAVGFSVHETSGSGYVVRERDAHAWCLVWDDTAKIWRDFDTTPGSWVEEEGKRASPLQGLADAWSWIKLQFSKFRWGQGAFRRYLLLALVPVVLVLLFQILRRQRRQNGKKPDAEFLPAWPGMDSEFYLVEQKLAERGVSRQLNEPLSEWLQRAAADPALADVKNALEKLLRLHYRHRFDPQGLSETEREELRREARESLAKISRRESAGT